MVNLLIQILILKGDAPWHLELFNASLCLNHHKPAGPFFVP